MTATRRIATLPLAAVLAVLAAGVGAAGAPLVLRVPLTLLLAFWLPGWAAGHALMPGVHRDRARHVAVSVGLSLAIAVVTAVQLAALGALHGRLWGVVLAAVTVVAAGVAHSRRLDDLEVAHPSRPRMPRSALLMGLAGLVALGGAVAVARTPLGLPADRGYTVLTIDPVAGDRQAATVTVRSEEAVARRFWVNVMRDDVRVSSRYVALAPGGAARQTIHVPAGQSGEIRVVLIDADAPRRPAYRQVRMHLPSLPTPPAAPSGVEGPQ